MKKLLTMFLCFVLLSSSMCIAKASGVPVLEFDGIVQGQKIMTDSQDVTVNLVSNGAQVHSVSLYADDFLVGTKSDAPYVFALSDAPTGALSLKAVANWGDSQKSQTELNVILAKTGYDYTYSTDFDTGVFAYTATNGSTRPDIFHEYINDNSNYTGYVKSRQVSGRGNCVEIGSKRSSVDPIGTSLGFAYRDNEPQSQVNIDVSAFRTKFDICFPTYGQTFKLTLRKCDGGGQSTLFGIDNSGNISVAESGTLISTGKKCQENVWYQILLTYNSKTNKYDLELGTYSDGTVSYETLADSKTAASGDFVSKHRISHIRHSTGSSAATSETPTYLLLDNYSVSPIFEDPYMTGISSVTGGTASAGVKHDADTIRIGFNADIASQDMTGKLSLTGDRGEVKVLSASYDASADYIEFITAALDSNADYILTLSKDIKKIGGDSFGYDMKKSFKTPAKALDVLSASLSETDGRAVFNVSICNNSGSEKSVIVLICAWADGKLADYISVGEVLNNGQTKTIDPPLGLSLSSLSGKTIEACVIDAATGVSITNKSWTITAS